MQRFGKVKIASKIAKKSPSKLLSEQYRWNYLLDLQGHLMLFYRLIGFEMIQSSWCLCSHILFSMKKVFF
jgi:hypothetical protein